MNRKNYIECYAKCYAVMAVFLIVLFIVACQPVNPRLTATVTATPFLRLISTEPPTRITTSKPPTPPPTRPTLPPTKIPEPTETMTPIPTLRPVEEWTTVFYPNIGVMYKTIEWTAYLTETLINVTTEIEHTLESRKVPTCQIQEMGATEVGPYGGPVPTPKQVKLKKVTYTVFKFDGPNVASSWYLLTDGLENYPHSDGAPIYIVSSTHKYWHQCEAVAKKVLETAHTTK